MAKRSVQRARRRGLKADGHTWHKPYSVARMLQIQAIKKAEKKRARRHRRVV